MTRAFRRSHSACSAASWTRGGRRAAGEHGSHPPSGKAGGRVHAGTAGPGEPGPGGVSVMVSRARRRAGLGTGLLRHAAARARARAGQDERPRYQRDGSPGDGFARAVGADEDLDREPAARSSRGDPARPAGRAARVHQSGRRPGTPSGLGGPGAGEYLDRWPGSTRRWGTRRAARVRRSRAGTPPGPRGGGACGTAGVAALFGGGQAEVDRRTGRADGTVHRPG